MRLDRHLLHGTDGLSLVFPSPSQIPGAQIRRNFRCERTGRRHQIFRSTGVLIVN